MAVLLSAWPQARRGEVAVLGPLVGPGDVDRFESRVARPLGSRCGLDEQPGANKTLGRCGSTRGWSTLV